MALARARQAARRVKDRWKAKQWYKVVTPPAFQSKLVGETLADDPSKLLGRRVEATLHELTGDMRLMHVKLFFQVDEIVDNEARTTFVGHTMTSDYVRRLTRRGHTKIPAVFDLQTKDGSRIRVKPFAVSDRRCQTTQAQEIRRKMQELVAESAQQNTLTGFLKDVISGDLTGRIYKEARKIHPVRRVEIARTEILGAPSVEMDETPVIEDMPEPEETEAIEADSEDEGAEASEDAEASGEEE